MWRVFIVLRCLWTLAPQTGYIHPDEFFQSVEVIAGMNSHYHVKCA